MWLGDDLFEALLIQKDVKPWTYLVGIALSLRFESFVNLEGCKTVDHTPAAIARLRALLI